MFGRGFEQQRKGGAIKASTINAGLRAASDLLKLRTGPGLDLKWLAGIPLLSLDGDASVAVRVAKAPAPIPARAGDQLGSGTAATYRIGGGGELEATGAEVEAWNLSSGAVAAGVYLILLRVFGRWLVIWEDCPPEPEPEPEPE
jgi:hypothetical protein